MIFAAPSLCDELAQEQPSGVESTETTAAPQLSVKERTEFLVKVGIMERATVNQDVLRETNEVTMDPSRRPGFCFLIDPPNDEPYEIYSVHYLPAPPEKLSGIFREYDPNTAVSGIKTPIEHAQGIRPFCYDFHPGDPLGEYRIEVFINGTRYTTLPLNVIAPD